jgi:hypothetical protein
VQFRRLRQGTESAIKEAVPRSASFLALSLALSLAAAACGQADQADAAGGGDSNGGAGGAPAECQVPGDCVPAASTCCECPSFAVPAAGGFGDGCADVGCPPAGDCPLVEATCESGQCQLICQAVATEQLCDAGFERDAFGCLLDACAVGPAPGDRECTVDGDCLEVPSDCCGCAQGGDDTAVPVDRADEFQSGLACNGNESCPGLDVCDAGLVARCLGGLCALAPPPDGGGPASGFCGTPDYPACPDGTTCVLNDPSAPDAAALGVGACLTL